MSPLELGPSKLYTFMIITRTGSMLGTTRNSVLPAAIVAALALTAATARPQNNPGPTAAVGPAIDAVAPDFTLSGATRYGVLKDPVKLSDFRGRTVVLAFFAQARTKG
jgi:hypothetical protein